MTRIRYLWGCRWRAYERRPGHFRPGSSIWRRDGLLQYSCRGEPPRPGKRFKEAKR